MGSIPLSTVFPSVPSLTDEAQAFVEDMLTGAREHAAEAVAEARSAIADLKTPLTNITIPDVPQAPQVQTSFSGLVQYAADALPDLGTISVSLPANFTPDNITIPDIISDIPAYTPLVTGLSIPDAPSPISVDLPTPPAIETDFELADAPTPDYGGIPDLYALTLPTFTAPTLAAFTFDAPSFTGEISEHGVDWTEPTYSGNLATTLTATLQTLLAGGTGIAPAVEQAIYERAAARIDKSALGEYQKAADVWASKGFALPPGAVNAARIQVDREAFDKKATQSTDIAVNQAKLEQENRQFAVKTGVELEGLFVQIFLAVTQRSYDIARFAVESRIQIFNALVAKFNVEQAVFAQRIAQYRVGLEYAQAQIAAYKAQIEAENVKADVNKSLIEAFRAKVQAFQAQADAYRSLVQAATARSEMQKNKVELYRAQVEGAQAVVAAKKQEFDAYSARVSGEVAKANLEDANARSYTARVGAITAAANITVKDAEVRIQNSQMKLQYAVAELQRLGALSSQQLQAIQARAAAFDVNTRRATAVSEADRATKQLAITATIEANRNLIAKYEADLEAWKARVQQIVSFATLQSEAMKTAGTIAGTLAAGALAGTSVSTAFNGSVGRSESNSQTQAYSETHNESDSTSSSVSTNTNYNHNISE